MRLAYLALIFAVSSLTIVQGENWPHWRGPNFDGSTSAQDLPTDFNKDYRKLWTADLSGEGASTPIVWGDRVFLTLSTPEEKAPPKQEVEETSGDEASAPEPPAVGTLAVCLSQKTGEVEWTYVLSEASRDNYRNTLACASPVTDGEQVFFFSGDGHLAACSLEGEKLWSANLQEKYGPFTVTWTPSSSPLLFEGALYLQVVQRRERFNGKGAETGNPSYLLALDPATGEEKWRVGRPSKAAGESQESYASPIPVSYGDNRELVLVGADCLTGHSPEDGREIWRWGAWNPQRANHWRQVSSAVYANGVIVACAPKGGPVYGFSAGVEGLLLKDDFLWFNEKTVITCDVPTPLYTNEFVFILNGRQRILSCLSARTGREWWSEAIPTRGAFKASPTAAGDTVYLVSEEGEVVLVRASENFEMIHQTNLGELGASSVESSVVPAGGKIYVRVGNQLHCFGK
ncbi:MAG: PQQ-binding-like beta-propeller repeat protein [Verrucomicrobiota bacterium]